MYYFLAESKFFTLIEFFGQKMDFGTVWGGNSSSSSRYRTKRVFDSKYFKENGRKSVCLKMFPVTISNAIFYKAHMYEIKLCRSSSEVE